MTTLKEEAIKYAEPKAIDFENSEVTGNINNKQTK